MSAADLRRLERSGDVLQLPRMMAALGLDPKAVSRAEPALFRDMQRVCTMCDSKKRCGRDLDRGTAAANYQAYCANTASLDALA